MNRARLARFLLSASAVLLLAGPGGASALSPPELPPAEIVFSNGGRIVSMNADGTDRSHLTRGTSEATWPDVLGQNGDFSPRISPDGQQMVFVRAKRQRGFDGVKGLMVAAADGTGARPILAGRRQLAQHQVPSWTADGRLVVVREIWKKRKSVTSVVTIGVDGSGMKTLVTYPPSIDRPPFDRLIDLRDAQLSPDGRKLLVEVNNAYMDNDTRLEVVNLDTGKRRSLGRNTFSGSWSPDGSAIVFASSAGIKSEVCEEYLDDCLLSADLYTIETDGTGRQRLGKTKANESSPSWSPGGDRILYTSNPAMPKAEAATEVYSMAIDGSCRVALTNGSPGSFSPSWAAAGSASPESCDQAAPPVLQEVEPSTYRGFGPVYWPGNDIDGLLLSSTGISFGQNFIYEDCDLAGTQPCGAQTLAFSFPLCYWSGLLPTLYGRADYRLFTLNGATILQQKDSSDYDGMMVMAGRSTTWLLSDGKAGIRTNRKMVRNMRRLGASGPPAGGLPAPQIPISDKRYLLKVERTVKRLGSKRAAAKWLSEKVGEIEETLRFGRRIRAIGPIRTFACPRIFLEDSGSSSARSADPGPRRLIPGGVTDTDPRDLLR